jgi:nocardicin N-oxygenase
MRVICELLGVPVEDQARFRGWTEAFLSVSSHTGEQIMQARMELFGYMQQLVAGKRAEPGEDLISGLIAARDEDAKLSEYELMYWCMALLMAGYETTAVQLSGAVLVLLHHDDQLARLREDYGLIPSAVEELVRYQVVGQSLPMLRYVTDDIDVEGTIIPKGACVIPAVDSANLDERVFSDPMTVDIARKDNHHLGFSAGTHFCAGAALARMELQVALEALLRRFPDLALAVPSSELRRNEGALMQNFFELPVSW